MKKLFCLLLILFMFVPSALADSDPLFISQHYSVFVDTRQETSGKGASPFTFDSLCMDVYFVEGSDTAYISTVRTFSGLFLSSGSVKVSVVDQDGILYFVSDDGNYITGQYDENGTDLWMDLEYGTFRLRPVPSFSMFDDWR